MGKPNLLNMNFPAVKINPDQQAQLIDNMLRSIGSLQSQTLNRARDTAAANNLPLDARLAQERAIAQQGAQAAQQGQFQIDQFVESKNRDLFMQLLGLTVQKDIAKKGFDAQKSAALLGALGSIGGGIGRLAGGG